MDRNRVTSSNIESIGYEPGTMILEVEFTSGRVYQYFSVPESVYESLMMNSSSVGETFDAEVKGSYDFLRIS